MSIKRRVLAISGIRSEYDLLSSLYAQLHKREGINFGLIVTGAHLSHTYGYTIKHIINDKLPIVARIESLIDSNSRASRLKSAAVLLQNCLHDIERFKPDIILYAGDREEAWVGAMAGAYLGIPTIHFFGGDHASDGNVDNPVRHAISKLSSLHFVSCEMHKRRLMAIGEIEKRIFVIGNPALDRFISSPSIDRTVLLKEVVGKKIDDYAILIFHPILGRERSVAKTFLSILQALKERDVFTFVSYPNIDAGNKSIIEVIEKHKNDEQFFFYQNFHRDVFINLMRHASFLIGNSSAGILEAPSIPLGVVNVGLRQKGRFCARNVVFVEEDIKSIIQGIDAVRDVVFQQELKKVISPFGEGNSAEMACDLIVNLNFREYYHKSEDPLL